MGGEGFADELDLIRTGKITAANIISSEWVGWASIDTMNSFFLGQQPADSGIGWTMVDKDHNLPPSGEFVPPVDFQAAVQGSVGRQLTAGSPDGQEPLRGPSTLHRRRPGSSAASPSGGAADQPRLQDLPRHPALIDVSFDVRPGQIHALVGGNGSGKSTLIKIMAGVYTADPGGTIEVNGTEMRADHTTPARRSRPGLHFVHQNPAVFPDLTVAENLAIGHGFEKTGFGGRIQWRAQKRTHRRAARAVRHPGHAADAGAHAAPGRAGHARHRPGAAGPGGREQAAARARRADRVAAAGRGRTRCMGALHRFAHAGQTILFVSHRLDEVIDSCDQATVLRDGRAGRHRWRATRSPRQRSSSSSPAGVTLEAAFRRAARPRDARSCSRPRTSPAARCAASASSCTGARCSASPGCSARVAPSC